jgi:hypothetical protein
LQQTEPSIDQAFMPLTRRQWLAVWVTAAVVLVIRIVMAGQRGFWLDEYYTYQAATLPLFDMIPERLSAGHSPLYFLYAKLFYLLFGSSEFALKATSAFAGALAVVGLAGLSARLGLNRLLPALLLISVFHPYWQKISTEFRYMMPLVTIGAFWSWAAVAHLQQPCRRHALASIAFGAIALWSHGSAQFIGGSLVIFYLLSLGRLPEERRRARPLSELFGPFVTAFCLSLPLLVVLSLMPKVSEASGSQLPSVRRAFTNQIETLYGEDAVFTSITGLQDDLFTVVSIIVYVLAVVAAIRFCRREKALVGPYLLGTLVGFPALVALITLVSKDVDGPARYVSFISLPLAILMGILWGEAGRWGGKGLAARVLMVLTIGSAFAMQALNQGDWHREAIRWLALHRRPDQPIITAGRNMNLLALEYHGVRDEGKIIGLNSEIGEKAVAINSLHKVLNDADSGFFFLYHRGDVEAEDVVEELLEEGFLAGTRTWRPTSTMTIIGLARNQEGMERLQRLPALDPPRVTDRPVKTKN